jgi:NhaA family Na+:H+ antiporter
MVLAGVTWLATFQSGVHATIAGVALGLITPSRPFHRPASALPALRHHLDAVEARLPADTEDVDEHELLEAARTVRETVSPLARLETLLHPWSAFLVLPLFALANAGVRVVDAPILDVLRQPVTLGVLVGLVLGKPLGIVGAAWLAVRLRLGALPAGAGWPHIVGVGALAGIGFTVALFVAELAFSDDTLIDAAKVGILCASVLAGLFGGVLLRFTRGRNPTQPRLRGSTG